MILLSLPVLYVLSVGPLLFVLKRLDDTTYNNHQFVFEILGSVYGPLVKSGAQSKSTGGKLLHSYMGLWISPEDFPRAACIQP
jgi:hypothetical protein